MAKIDSRVLVLGSDAANQVIEAVHLLADGFDNDAAVVLSNVHHFVQLQMHGLHHHRGDADHRAVSPFFYDHFHAALL